MCVRFMYMLVSCLWFRIKVGGVNLINLEKILHLDPRKSNDPFFFYSF